MQGFLRRHCFRGRDTLGLPRKVSVSSSSSKTQSSACMILSRSSALRAGAQGCFHRKLTAKFPEKLFHKRTLFHCNTSEPYHPSMIGCGHDPPGQQFFTGRSAGLLPCAARSTVFVAKLFHKRIIFYCTSEPYHPSVLESVLPEVVAVEAEVFCYR